MRNPLLAVAAAFALIFCASCRQEEETAVTPVTDREAATPAGEDTGEAPDVKVTTTAPLTSP